MKNFYVIVFLLSNLFILNAQDKKKIDFEDCTFNGFPLYGKIQVVDSFPDIKVQIVESFPDIKVKVVESFPDFKIQFVDSFPDIKIKFVESFPGKP
jgi:hypothetical protein